MDFAPLAHHVLNACPSPSKKISSPGKHSLASPGKQIALANPSKLRLQFVDPCPLPSLALTSTVLKPTNGEYNFGDLGLLTPHETLRIMTERGRRALEFYNPEKCPWKTARAKFYFENFYNKFLHEHHDAEEEMFFPYYKALGATDFEKQGADHKVLLALLDDFMNAFSLNNGDELRAKYKIFCEHLLGHLAEEEEYWPAVIRRYGKDKLEKIEQTIVDNGIKNGGAAFQMALIEVCEGMGVNLTGPHPEHGWASKAVKDNMKKKLPKIVRSVLAPMWRKNWEYHTDMLLSITTDIETPVLRATGCCTIM